MLSVPGGSDRDVGAQTREELSRDPYPVYRRLRDKGACVWLDAANRYVVSRWEDVVRLDEVPGISAREERSLMTRAMGRTMLRTDGEEHARLRAPAQAPLRFRGFAKRWGDMLAREAHDLLSPLRDRGHMDVLREFAGPFAARTLKLVLGLHAARDEDFEFASQAFIDGTGNYATTQTRGSAASAGTGSSTRRSPPTGTAQRTAPSCARSSTPARSPRRRCARTSSSSSPAGSTSRATSSPPRCTRCSPTPSRRRSQ
jgi:cytochrome P450